MLMNDRKTSYYDEYQRKKETNRSLVTPPTLLTDRGAYVNFLEVQLERVSAACLAVQSYDDRFTDMQNLIVALENRCATTTRLTSLAQQCSEEIRAESYTITNRLTQELNGEQRKSNELFESVSSRLHSAELRLQSVASLESRLLMIESKYHALEDSKILADKEHRQEIMQMKTRVDAVLSENHQLRSEIDHTNTLVSQQIFDAKEETNKVKNMLHQLEDRFEGRIAAITEDCEAKLHAMQCKHNNYVDSLNYSFAQRELELNSLHSKQFGKVGCDLTELNQLVGGELREVKQAVQSSEQNNAGIQQSVSELRSDVNNQQTQLFHLEEKFITRLESLLSRYRIPAENEHRREKSRSSRSLLDQSSISEVGAPVVHDLSEIPHLSSGSDTDEALKNRSSRSNRSSSRTTRDSDVTEESELQALLKSILNTTTANNTALNALAAVNASDNTLANSPSSANKSRRNLSALDSSVLSPRSSQFMRSRSLSPQRLLGSTSIHTATASGNAAAAVSIDPARQRSHDSLRAMGVSPGRVMGPPPFLDAASVLQWHSQTRNNNNGRVEANVSPQRCGTRTGGSGDNSRSNSALSTRSDSGGGRRSSKKSAGKKHKNKGRSGVNDDNDAAVAELAKSLSFSLTSPTRRQRVSATPATASVNTSLTHHTVSSLERVRQSAEHRLMSPPRLSSSTAALLVARPDQLEALRAKGVFFRSSLPPSGYAATSTSHSGIELWPHQQLHPAWKKINTYVPPGSYSQFDNPRPASGSGVDALSEAQSFNDYTTNNIITKVHSNVTPSSQNSGDVSVKATSASVSSESKASDVTSSVEGSSTNNGSASATAMINAVKASMLRSEGTQTATAATASVAVGGESDSRSDSRNRGVQTEIVRGVSAENVTHSAVPSVNNSRSNSATRPTRSGSNLRSAAHRLNPHNSQDMDAHVAFYRPVSPLSHARLSKILEQYPLPTRDVKG